MEATAPQTPVYSHRRNADQTFDSICHRCFSTVATVPHEADLAWYEQRHQCEALAQARSLARKEPCASQQQFTAPSIDAA